MIEINQHPNCQVDKKACAFCGKTVKDVIHNVHIGLGGMCIVSDEEHDALEATGKYEGDLGYSPVCVDCWKLHPEAHIYHDGAGPTLPKELAKKMVDAV